MISENGHNSMKAREISFPDFEISWAGGSAAKEQAANNFPI